MGLNVLVVAVAFAIGPTVASAILSVGQWPLLFAINIPLGIAGFAIGMLMLPNTPRAKYRFDVPLAVLTAGAFGFLGLGLSGAAHANALEISGPEILIGLIFAAMMLRRQANHPAPMLPVDLFKIPVFALSTVTAICSFATQGLAFVALPFYLEQILGRSQIETGFLITPWPIAVALTATLAGRLLDRYPAGILGGVGLITLSLGMISLAVLPAHPSTLNIVWRMAVCGAGFGFFQSPNLKILMASAPANRAGGASGVVTLARLTGQTTGAAMVALCFSLAGRHGSILGLGLGAAFAAVAALASFFRLLVPIKQAEA
jgi:DHA2 family multidrug resistance protein-like MFS transporter